MKTQAPELKICAKCSKEKTLDLFVAKCNSCKACKKLYAQQFAKDNKKKIKEQRRNKYKEEINTKKIKIQFLN